MRFALLALIILTSCGIDHHVLQEKTVAIAKEQGLNRKIYQAKEFKIFTLQKITDQKKPLHVYIEGDGKAFIDSYTVSSNPTPTSFFLINLIAKDNHPNIIYMARPCQYVTDKFCSQKYWTSDRFSKEVLRSMNEVFQNFSDYKIELIGYSGGAEIAKYFIQNNKNILNLRTIAGNLDHSKFTQLHHSLPLKHSINGNLEQLSKIPQIHFVGSKDSVVPLAVAETYLKKLPKTNCVKVIEVEGMGHVKGWINSWSELISIKPQCETYNLSFIPLGYDNAARAATHYCRETPHICLVDMRV